MSEYFLAYIFKKKNDLKVSLGQTLSSYFINSCHNKQLEHFFSQKSKQLLSNFWGLFKKNC